MSIKDVHNEMMKPLEGLSKTVKYTKWPSALAYEEMNIHVKEMSNYEKKMC